MADLRTKDTLQIYRAGQSQESKVVDTIVLAFSADPCLRWLYPEPHQFIRNFPDFVRAFGGKAFQQDTAFYMEGFPGAALWLPPSVQPDEHRLVTHLEQTVPEERQETVFAVLEQMNNFHPGGPHWYLPLIGVEPAQQRKGIGSMLMKQGVALCDRDKMPAYLEATNPENISLYKRYGFEVLGIIEEGDSPPLTPMFRSPKIEV